jgi:hypothetical protein
VLSTEHTLSMFRNRALREIFGHGSEEARDIKGHPTR